MGLMNIGATESPYTAKPEAADSGEARPRLKEISKQEAREWLEGRMREVDDFTRAVYQKAIDALARSIRSTKAAKKEAIRKRKEWREAWAKEFEGADGAGEAAEAATAEERARLAKLALTDRDAAFRLARLEGKA